MYIPTGLYSVFVLDPTILVYETVNHKNEKNGKRNISYASTAGAKYLHPT